MNQGLSGVFSWDRFSSLSLNDKSDLVYNITICHTNYCKKTSRFHLCTFCYLPSRVQSQQRKHLFKVNNKDRSSHWRCSVKRAVLTNFPVFTENTFVEVICCLSHLKLQTPAILLKRDSNTGVFL